MFVNLFVAGKIVLSKGSTTVLDTPMAYLNAGVFDVVVACSSAHVCGVQSSRDINKADHFGSIQSPCCLYYDLPPVTLQLRVILQDRNRSRQSATFPVFVTSIVNASSQEHNLNRGWN